MSIQKKISVTQPAIGKFIYEIVVVRQAGKKNIVLRCLKGVIYVNTKEVTTYELYDDDVIEIGKVKLQFNWIEHQRPAELSSGEDVY